MSQEIEKVEQDDDEILALDLDWDLVNHLAIPESVTYLLAEDITTDHLEDDDVARIYEWQIEHRRDHGMPATASVLEEEFDIGIEKPLSAIGDLVQRLRTRWMKNHGKEALLKLGDEFMENPTEVPRMMLQAGRELALMVSHRGESYGSGDFERSMRAYDQEVIKGRGPSFGFEEIDDHFYGQRGITFVIAPPKGLKSWFTINSLIKNVAEERTCVHYPLELTGHETDMRVRCMAAGVPFWKFLRHSLSKEDRQRLRDASEALDDLGYYKLLKPKPGFRDIDRLIGEARDLGADVIYIDQLQYVENRKGVMLGERNDPGEYWGVLDRARTYSEDGPLWFAHQFNRTVMNADSLPEMQQAKGSAAIEEVATLALGMWANKDMRRSSLFEIGTLASRNYTFTAWEIGIEFNDNCNLKMLGEASED